MGRAWPIRDLDPGEDLKVCLRRILLTRCEEMYSFEPAVLSQCDADSVHDMRVSARRLQAVLRIFRECFPKDHFKLQSRMIRSLIKGLGKVREHDVFMATLRRFRPKAGSAQHGAIELLLEQEGLKREARMQDLKVLLLRLQRGDFVDGFKKFIRRSL